MSTPVVVAGQAYLHSRAQKLVCFDVATGVKRWETEQKFGKYMSLVAQGDRILALDERGILFLFRADASGFKLEGQRKMADAEAWAHLALSGGDVVVREQTGVSAWAWSAVPAKPPGS
jgi:outer membrane protein assembly factor BamB